MKGKQLFNSVLRTQGIRGKQLTCYKRVIPSNFGGLTHPMLKQDLLRNYQFYEKHHFLKHLAYTEHEKYTSRLIPEDHDNDVDQEALDEFWDITEGNIDLIKKHYGINVDSINSLLQIYVYEKDPSKVLETFGKYFSSVLDSPHLAERARAGKVAPNYRSLKLLVQAPLKKSHQLGYVRAIINDWEDEAERFDLIRRFVLRSAPVEGPDYVMNLVTETLNNTNQSSEEKNKLILSAMWILAEEADKAQFHGGVTEIVNTLSMFLNMNVPDADTIDLIAKNATLLSSGREDRGPKVTGFLEQFLEIREQLFGKINHEKGLDSVTCQIISDMLLTNYIFEFTHFAPPEREANYENFINIRDIAQHYEVLGEKLSEKPGLKTYLKDNTFDFSDTDKWVDNH
mmetsp:Transcript_847/g.1319  ORF Transcript_847/g.1319 Transcript_847/m.1319 type:complete len:398 (+) Transcript_847:28-1221(+)